MLRDLSPQRRLFMVGVLGVVVAIVVILAVAALHDSPPEPRSADVPVILVHGYGGTPASMGTLAAALKHVGRRVTTVALPQHGEAELSREAHVLSAAVDRTGPAKVDLVGFSAGSIVVRTYLSSASGRSKARRVVLLGAPNHGTTLASLALSTDPSLCLDACRELTRGSGFLRALNSHAPPAAVPITVIWTHDDKVVTPPGSAVLAGAANVEVQSVCPKAVLAHGDLVTSPVAIGLTLTALRGHPGSSCKEVRKVGVDALSS
jgi:triacylglycerol lipase